MLNVISGLLSGGAAPAAATSYESIATSNPSSGTSITFSSIPQTYKHLQIRGIGRTDRGNVGDVIYMRFNGDTGSNYRAHELWANGSSVSSYDQGLSSYMAFDTPLTGGSTGSNIFGAFVIDILDYTNTNKNKTVRMLDGYDSNGAGQISFCSGLWMNTAAVTSITLPISFGQMQSGTQFALYGVKG